jgi:hypothetical protein
LTDSDDPFAGSSASSIVELALVAAPEGTEPWSIHPSRRWADFAIIERHPLEVVAASLQQETAGVESLRITFEPDDAARLMNWTSRHVGHDMGVIVDGRIITVLAVESPFPDTVYIGGDFIGPNDSLIKLAARIRESIREHPTEIYAPSIDKNSWIELERMSCAQRCAQYTVRICGDGSIRYSGTSGVSVRGERTDTVSADAVRRLFQRCSAMDFFRCPEDSVWESDAVTPSALTVKVRAQVKRCVRRTDMPRTGERADRVMCEILDVLAEAVDHESHSWRWVGKFGGHPRPGITRELAFEPKDPSALETDPSALEIRLTRTPCFGNCSSYEIRLLGDGTVRYTGKSDVKVLGVANARIATDMVQELLDRFQTIGFWQLKDVYDTRVTDIPSTELALSIDSRTKTVVNRWTDAFGVDRVPDLAIHRALDEVALAIDVAVNSPSWVEPDNAWWLRR